MLAHQHMPDLLLVGLHIDQSAGKPQGARMHNNARTSPDTHGDHLIHPILDKISRSRSSSSSENQP